MAQYSVSSTSFKTWTARKILAKDKRAGKIHEHAREPEDNLRFFPLKLETNRKSIQNQSKCTCPVQLHNQLCMGITRCHDG